MRVFLAGATGVIGRRLIPILIAGGHQVAGLTRSPSKVDLLCAMGAHPVVCDVFDAARLADAVVDFGAEAVIHELTDLPDDPSQIGEHAAANARIRREGTRHLLAASRSAGAERFVAQSVAWRLAGDAGVAVDDLERMVLDAEGVVIRYGRFYGPGTYYETELPPAPRIHIDQAALRTLSAFQQKSTVMTVVDDD